MEIALLKIKGRWAHFKKPETNNNPLTHDFITKTALIGMMGAVLGVEREQMCSLFPVFSQDLRYGVALETRVWKQSWSFTLRRFDPKKTKLEPDQPVPRAFEFLREPHFTVVLALADQRSSTYFAEFVRLVGASETHFEPVLGLHNCPAEVELLDVGEADLSSGRFETRGFVPRDRRPQIDTTSSFRVGFERIPTAQDDSMWNPPGQYVEVIYTDVAPFGQKPLLTGEGEYCEVRFGSGVEEAWCLI